jgi:hypothetical protein
MMLRKVLLVCGLCLLASFSARAQEEKVEVFGGYSYLRFHSSPSINLNGWEASGQYKFTDWLGGVADFDGHYGDVSTHTFLFGPQVSWPSRVSPFGHILLGGAHISAGGFGNSSFAMAIGGGIDTTVGRGLRWRVIQGDYLLTQFGGGSQNNARLSTGIIFRF